MNKLQLKILEEANSVYPHFIGLQIQNDKVVGLDNYDIDDVVSAMIELQDLKLISKEAVRISCDGLYSLGNLEITSLGRNRL